MAATKPTRIAGSQSQVRRRNDSGDRLGKEEVRVRWQREWRHQTGSRPAIPATGSHGMGFTGRRWQRRPGSRQLVEGVAGATGITGRQRGGTDHMEEVVAAAAGISAAGRGKGSQAR